MSAVQDSRKFYMTETQKKMFKVDLKNAKSFLKTMRTLLLTVVARLELPVSLSTSRTY